MITLTDKDQLIKGAVSRAYARDSFLTSSEVECMYFLLFESDQFLELNEAGIRRTLQPHPKQEATT